MKEKIIGTKLKNQECKKKKSKLIIFKPMIYYLVIHKLSSQYIIWLKLRSDKLQMCVLLPCFLHDFLLLDNQQE